MELILRRKLEALEKVSSLLDRREKLQFAGVTLVALAAALFQALGVVSVLPFVELVMEPDVVQESVLFGALYEWFRFESTLSFTMFVGVVVLGTLVVGNFVAAFAEWVKIRFVWQKNHALSVGLLHRYLSLPYIYFLHAHSADLSKNIIYEVQQFTMGVLMPLLQVITKGMVVLVLIALLLFVNPGIALGAAVVFIVSYIVIFSFLRSALKTRGRQRLQENTGRFTAAGEALAGIKDIKALGREEYFLHRFSQHSDTFSNLQAWTSVVTQLPRYLMEIIAFGGAIALILVFLWLRQGSSQIIPLISFFAFAGYRIMPAVQIIFQSVSNIQFHRATLDRLSEDMRGAGERFAPGAQILPDPLAFRDRIEFAGVSFMYPYAHEQALRGVNLEIPKGKVVGFVGPTGGGKTTIIDILIGLLFPSQGSLKVDGIVVGEANVRNWQRNIGYVPQQIFLADDTVTHNIAFGLPDESINATQVARVCQIANLDGFIAQELPGGYDTLIGERGVRLSGGQRQRIGIARALYHNPEVLVLDEATSSLDGATEKAVLEAIGNVARFKTLVIVAHRLTTIQKCDTVYVVEKGQVIAQGTYNSLLKTNTIFQAMAQRSEAS